MIIQLAGFDKVVINSSAGKDSQAMLTTLMEAAKEQGIDAADKFLVVHADMGRAEWAGTRELAEEQARPAAHETKSEGVPPVSRAASGAVYQVARLKRPINLSLDTCSAFCLIRGHGGWLAPTHLSIKGHDHGKEAIPQKAQAHFHHIPAHPGQRSQADKAAEGGQSLRGSGSGRSIP